MQTCVNCKSHRQCTSVTDARTVSSVDECRYYCIMAKSACKMASYEHRSSHCQMFAQNHCDSVEEETRHTVFRWACPSGNSFYLYCVKIIVVTACSIRLVLWIIFEKINLSKTIND